MKKNWKRSLTNAFALVCGIGLGGDISAENTHDPDRSLRLHAPALSPQYSDTITYYKDGQYNHKALTHMKDFLQDPKTGDRHDVSFALLDFLYQVKERVRKSPDIEPRITIISGYRSPQSNAELRQPENFSWSKRVAKKSRHIHGDAIDFSIEGATAVELRNAAWCLKQGGVGYYPDIVQKTGYEYIHIDTARIRFWGSNFDFTTIPCPNP